MIPYINTVKGISVVCKGVPYHIASSDRQYREVVDAIEEERNEDDIYNIICATRKKIEQALQLSENMTYCGGTIKYLGMPMHGYAVDVLVDLIHMNGEIRPLANFLDKLQKNPSRQTVDNLYEFLQYGKIPITERGTFLAYKAIRSDWKDIHSGKFDNSIGATLSMPRNMVDDDRGRTCSTGFHVCSYEYLPHFAHADGHVVICEVDPADVVSIPCDYNNTKMRVSAYKVVGEVDDYYRRKENILAADRVWQDLYSVQAREFDTDEWEEVYSCNDINEAIEIAEEEFEDGGECGEDWCQVKVMHRDGSEAFRKSKCSS